MGIIQAINWERKHMAKVAKGHAEGESPVSYNSYTAELKIKYLKPVLTPGALIVTAKYVKIDGRKEWIHAEIKQRDGAGEDHEGDEILCATGEGLFIQPKSIQSKL